MEKTPNYDWNAQNIEILYKKNWQNWPFWKDNRQKVKNPSMSYLSLSGGKCTLIRLRKKSVILVCR